MPINLFDANFYRQANPDLVAAGLNTDGQLLSHFQNTGINEGRAFSSLVDLKFYRSSNSDLAQLNNKQLFDHLQNSGVREGRRFSPIVDLQVYKEANVDLVTARLDNEQLLEHLRSNGVRERRLFSEYFDTNVYLNSNPDLVQAGLTGIQLFNHFQLFGVNEQRVFSPIFNSTYYSNANPDLIAAKLTTGKQLLDHFISFGQNEGRIASSQFNAQAYIAGNPDLQAAKFTSRQAFRHFVVYGQRESRFGGADFAGNSLNQARNFNLTETNTIFTDFVGSVDANDYYQFSINAPKTLNLTLGGLTANADVELLGQTGNIIKNGIKTGTNAESFSANLEAGTYAIRVFRVGDSNTNYNLTVSSGSAQSFVLYNGTLGTTPNTQNFLDFASVTYNGLQSTLGTGGTQTATSNGTTLTTNQAGYAGYSNYRTPTVQQILTGQAPTLLNSNFPTLNASNGYSIRFKVKVNSESNTSDVNSDGLKDRAGFSVIALSSNKTGVELGFWTDEIWAQTSTPLFTHSSTERAFLDTTVARNYELSILGANYQLFADGSLVLSGQTKDYTPFNHTGAGLPYDPYELSNLLFFGDNTTSAQASITLESVSLIMPTAN
jgi:Bacterial pre-peptidase C-terminal domain